MWLLIVIIVVAGSLAAGASLLWDKDSPIEVGPDCTACEGGNPKCEQVCMMEAATRPTEYFDDEELDRFRGRDSASYSDDEAETFREVMLSMRPQELRAWGRSLVLRQVNMPDQIKDDFILLSER